MKNIYIGLMVISMFVLPGCNQGIPGGPGATNQQTKKPPFGESVQTFNLSAPLLPTFMKQGERINTSISIKRGSNFDEDVTLKFSTLPTGVTLDPSTAVIKHGDVETKLMIVAKNDAAVGHFNILVTGHPTKGADALINFKLNIDKK